MTTEHALAVRPSDTLSIPQLVAQVNLIQEAMGAVMHSGEHYGVIPGTGSKPSLLKPGAEKLATLFRLDPQYEWTEVADGLHRTYVVKCTLYHIPSGNRVASGLGSCSTRESKYAYRKAERTCPECGQSTIIKGRAEYGGGWLCYAKKGGCGAKWPDGADVIEKQEVGRVENENLPDVWNTVLKMGCKRALVAAVLNATAASDIFTQDIEELVENAAVAAPTAPVTKPAVGLGWNAPPPADAPAPARMPDPKAAAQAATTAGFGAPKMPAANVAAPLGICEVHKIPWSKPRTGGGPGHYFTPAIPRGDGKGDWCHQSKPKDAPPLAQVAAEVAAARHAVADAKEEPGYRVV